MTQILLLHDTLLCTYLRDLVKEDRIVLTSDTNNTEGREDVFLSENTLQHISLLSSLLLGIIHAIS